MQNINSIFTAIILTPLCYISPIAEMITFTLRVLLQYCLGGLLHVVGRAYVCSECGKSVVRLPVGSCQGLKNGHLLLLWLMVTI